MLNQSKTARLGAVSAAALLAMSLAPAQAQEAQTEDQQTQAQEQSGGGQQETGTQAPGQQPDTLIVTVGEQDLRASDVMAVIDAMPSQMRQQPREMLVPMAIQQAVLRELILQQAVSENLADDPEVVAIVEEEAQVARDDAMVGVWLTREMEERVTDDRVQQVYDRLLSEAEDDLPPLAQVRPQIEQQLSREAIEGIRSELSDNISVVYYGPDGQPIETTAEAEPGTTPERQEGGSESAGSTGGATSGSGSASASSGSDSGSGSGSGATDGGTAADANTGGASDEESENAG